VSALEADDPAWPVLRGDGRHEWNPGSRLRVGQLDGLEIDGHEVSDPDTSTMCLHCLFEGPDP